MDKLSQLVFTQHQIVTYNTLTTVLGKSIDDSCNTLYQFYSANKSKLATYFLVILNGSTDVSISIERLSGKELLEKLKDTEYQKKIRQVKLWAVCDKNVDEFGLEEIYHAEKHITGESQHGVQEISQKIRELKIDETPPVSQNDKKLKPGKSASFGEEKNLKKSASQSDSQLEKKGSFETSKAPEKKGNAVLETKKSADFSKKPSFVEEKPVVQEEKPKPAENKKKKATTDPVVETEQPLKKAKTINEKEENNNLVRPKLDSGLKSFFAKKSQSKILEEDAIDDEIPIADTNEEKLEDYFKHKKPSQDKIEDPPINVSIKSKPKKVATDEEESYYDGYIAEPVRERSPTRETAEPKVKRVAKKEAPEVDAPYVEQKNPEYKVIDGKTYVKKMKTVMTEKSYLDEKEYLVCEQVPVLEETWEEVRREPTQSQALAQSDKKPLEKGQKSLTSFFKKM